MEKASSAVISKPKILPVVLLSSIPLRLVKGGREERKINLRQNRTQPYTNDNQRSLSERSTACSNCNKQTNNQSSSKGSETLAGMIQSPMLILPIVSSKIHSNVYGNQQQHHQPVYYTAKKAVDESNSGSCRVREISCSFFVLKYTNYNFFILFCCLVCALSLFLVLHPIFHVMSFCVASFGELNGIYVRLKYFIELEQC